ncbi:MAG: hypothetical protein J6X02_03980, partial [Bacilli bacterium]|nr:hypothetical protein [Bacilli bacterium]
MINFIICDDNKEFLKFQKNIIDKFMMNYDVEYKCHMLIEYNDAFTKLVSDDIGFKIYLLDIQTKNGSGLDAARLIREEYDDWVSVIMIITAYNEFKYEALSNRLYLLDFINKLNNCEEKIKEDLLISLKHFDNRSKCLRYEYNHIYKQIEFRHIVYIEKEPDSKRCRIKTVYGDQIINKNLNDTFKLLDDRFIKTS